MLQFLKSEYVFILSLITAILFITFPGVLSDSLNNPGISFGLFLVIFMAMLLSSFSAVRHADELAIKLGEPYGTLILTISVITIEVVAISSVMLTGDDNPTLGRDMMFSVIMIALNGLVGISLLAGAVKHIQQDYNLQGVNTFLSVITPLAIMGMILPNYTESTEYGTFSTIQTYFLIIVTLSMYFIFLFMQTLRHKNFFMMDEDDGQEEHTDSHHSTAFHAMMLIAYLIPIVLLSKKLAIIVNHSISSMGAPAALGGLLIAILVLSPEGVAAVKSALNNQLQRSMNITMGSTLATIALTIPAVLIIGLVTDKKVILGLDGVDTVLLWITILVNIINFSSGKSNMIQGMIHLVLFVLYLLLIFD